jgi:hypothetical protein
MKDEASYVCDSCGEEIVVPIDLSAGKCVATTLFRASDNYPVVRSWPGEVRN